MFQAAVLKDGKFTLIPTKELYRMTLQQIIDSGFAFKFEMPIGIVYFTSSKASYEKLRLEGKNVQWLQALFDGWRIALVAMGYPEDKPITGWTLYDLNVHNSALAAFSDSKLETLPQA